MKWDTEQQVPMHLFTCKEAKAYVMNIYASARRGKFNLLTSSNIILGTDMCVTLLQGNSYMMHKYMILTLLWITDSREATTRPEKRKIRGTERERCIPTDYQKECCTALIIL